MCFKQHRQHPALFQMLCSIIAVRQKYGSEQMEKKPIRGTCVYHRHRCACCYLLSLPTASMCKKAKLVNNENALRRRTHFCV